ncbi:MAG: aminotransferase class V-fold PLP-dependent enzyme [Gorillibacterium sp.]|nr:aminotransferase class V-fold PLP-dependent enzyme [Gorillibacterium sp.]
MDHPLPDRNPASMKGSLEEYFTPYRQKVAGIGRQFRSPYGWKIIRYADWAASGRIYLPIEHKLLRDFAPLVANTHTESTATGAAMTEAYHEAKRMIKQHVHAGEHDILLFCGNGMTAAVNKLQRLMGLRGPAGWKAHLELPEQDRPIVFVTHMEHHSNQLSWQETLCDIHIVKPDEEGRVSISKLEEALQLYPDRLNKIGAFTTCSNVTGVKPDIHKLAAVMHRHGGIVCVDWTASAPYTELNMHPEQEEERLDAIYYSPHKFLGGPGASGVLIFDSRLAASNTPDHPGGGTVIWTDRWKGCIYVKDREEREDGGTPGFLQAAKVALAISLKNQMGIHAMQAREEELVDKLFTGLSEINSIHLLDGHLKERQPIISFYAESVHYPLFVRLLNDRFGIQARGGCSCAGTYGHFLFGLDKATSERIRARIKSGDLKEKPGWVRLSLHPIMTDADVAAILYAVRSIVQYAPLWRADYRYNPANNDYLHYATPRKQDSARWFLLTDNAD